MNLTSPSIRCAADATDASRFEIILPDGTPCMVLAHNREDALQTVRDWLTAHDWHGAPQEPVGELPSLFWEENS